MKSIIKGLCTLTIATIAAVCMLTLAPKAHATSGTCGDNVTWTLDNTGTLTISGSGDMTDIGYYEDAPWYSERLSIKNVIIDDNITRIGDYAFEYCRNLTTQIYRALHCPIQRCICTFALHKQKLLDFPGI